MVNSIQGGNPITRVGSPRKKLDMLYLSSTSLVRSSSVLPYFPDFRYVTVKLKHLHISAQSALTFIVMEKYPNYTCK